MQDEVAGQKIIRTGVITKKIETGWDGGSRESESAAIRGGAGSVGGGYK